MKTTSLIELWREMRSPLPPQSTWWSRRCQQFHGIQGRGRGCCGGGDPASTATNTEIHCPGGEGPGRGMEPCSTNPLREGGQMTAPKHEHEWWGRKTRGAGVLHRQEPGRGDVGEWGHRYPPGSASPAVQQQWREQIPLQWCEGRGWGGGQESTPPGARRQHMMTGRQQEHVSTHCGD